MTAAEVIEFPVEYRRGFEKFVDKHEVARVLGKSVSWVEKKSRDRSFPSYKIAGNRRYRLSEVVAWAERGAA